MGMKRYFRVEQPRVRLDLLLILSAVFLLLCNVFFSLITKQTQNQKIQQIEVLMSDYLQVAKQLREAEVAMAELNQQEMLFNGQADSTTIEQLKQRMALFKQQAAEAKAAMEELKRQLLPLLEDVFEKQKPKKQNEKIEPKVWT